MLRRLLVLICFTALSPLYVVELAIMMIIWPVYWVITGRHIWEHEPFIVQFLESL